MCSIVKKKVKWTINSDFLNKIKRSINTADDEIAGKMLFTDYNCKNGTCNKSSTKFTIINGDGPSVMTPKGIINYHTHPVSAYIGENAVYGWPSGEDLLETINFKKNNTLIHIVFTLEGAYIIHVNKLLSNVDRKLVERLFKMTHVFRTNNQNVQLKEFKKFVKPIFNTRSSTTLGIWLQLVNKITIKDLRKFFGKLPSNDNQKIFDVKLIKMNKNTLSFNAYYIHEKCHIKSFGKSR